MNLRLSFQKLSLFLCALLFAGYAISQEYPNRPVKIIVPYPAGGGSDIVARLIAARLQESRGWSVIVENRSGAAGISGTEAAARSTPDGYTLMLGTNATHGIFASLYPKLPYDPVKDFAPVSIVGTVNSVLVASPSLPVKSVKELIALAKSKPGQLNYASAGSGSAAHLSMELLNITAGIKTVHVPYKGVAPALVDLMAGRVQLLISNMPPVIEHIHSGQLVALGIADAKRAAVLPAVATIAEQGVTGYQADVWLGIFAPARTSLQTIATLNKALREVLSQPETKKRLLGIGVEPVGNTPEEFATTIKSDIVKWAEVVRESGAKPE